MADPQQRPESGDTLEVDDDSLPGTRKHWWLPGVAIACMIIIGVLVAGLIGGDETTGITTTGGSSTPSSERGKGGSAVPTHERADRVSWATVTPGPTVLGTGVIVAWTGESVLMAGGVELRPGPGPDGVAEGSYVEYSRDGEVLEQGIMHEFTSPATTTFDPETGRWQRLADAPLASQTAGVWTWTGSELLVLVRENAEPDNSGDQVDTGVAVFDPTANEWDVRDAPDAIGCCWGFASAFTGTEMVALGLPVPRARLGAGRVRLQPGRRSVATDRSGPSAVPGASRRCVDRRRVRDLRG